MPPAVDVPGDNAAHAAADLVGSSMGGHDVRPLEMLDDPTVASELQVACICRDHRRRDTILDTSR
jgi:hypothetical protein